LYERQALPTWRSTAQVRKHRFDAGMPYAASSRCFDRELGRQSGTRQAASQGPRVPAEQAGRIGKRDERRFAVTFELQRAQDFAQLIADSDELVLGGTELRRCAPSLSAAQKELCPVELPGKAVADRL